MLQLGARNRHVGVTAMNKESSRSHSVFSIFVESKHTPVSGLTTSLHGRLNLVDLAGSERQKSTSTFGMQLKEAGNINKSLSTLGTVFLFSSKVSACLPPPSLSLFPEPCCFTVLVSLSWFHRPLQAM